MYFKTKKLTINSAQIAFYTEYKHLMIYWYLKFISTVKKEGHHLPPQMKNDPHRPRLA